MPSPAPGTPPPKKENILLNLAFNLVIPSLLLSEWGRAVFEFTVNRAYPPLHLPLVRLAEQRLVLAVMFPAVYFLSDYLRRRQANVISVFGFVCILLSGVIGLMKLDPFWFAVKEAAFPAVIGAGLYLSQCAGKPLVRAFVWHESVIHTGKITEAASSRGRAGEIDGLFAWCTRMLAPVFFLSAAAHFALARLLVTAHPETAQDAFNAQLSKFNFIAWPLVLLPLMGFLMWLTLRFMKRLVEVSGLTEEELYR